MALWSEVKISKLGPRFRIDSEYYQPYFLQILDKLQKMGATSLGTCHARIQKTKFTAKKKNSFDYIEISRVSTTLGTYETINILDEEAPSRAQYVVKPGNILVSEVRPNRSAIALIPKDIGRSICSSGFAVIEPESVTSEFLFAYFKTDLVTHLLTRETTATMYPAISDDDILRLPFIKPSDTIEKKVTSKIKEAFFLLTKSQKLYTRAEHLLLNELGIKPENSTANLFYERPFSDVQQTSRLDAEYFQPAYQKIVDICSAYKGGAETLATLLDSITNGVECRTFVEEGTPYIRVGDMGKLRIQSSNAVQISSENAKQLSIKISLRKGDVLTARSGTIGQACVITNSDLHSILSSHIMRLRLRKDCSVQSDYLALFLATTPGIQQVFKNGNGGIVPEISQPFMKRIVIPILDKPIQDQLSKLVQESHQAEDKSRRLIEEAKQVAEKSMLGEKQ